jgi:hypothetical protein
MLRRVEPEIGHQRAGALKSAEAADLGRLSASDLLCRRPMLTRGGAARIGGVAPDRASEPTSLLALDSGGAERGILTAGTPDGMPAGTQTPGVIGANGTVAKIKTLGR